MNVHKTAAIVAQSRDLVDLLPRGGKLEILNHLISQLCAEDLDGLSDDARQLLLKTLSIAGNNSEVTASVASPGAEPFALEAAPHKVCRFKACDTGLSRDVTFIIPEGVSGRQILRAIEKANPRANGDGVVWPHSAILKNDELDAVFSADTSFDAIVHFGGSEMTRREQEHFLALRHLDFTPRWILTVAAALYRDANGFPSDSSDIGTTRDEGDLFRGMVVRAAAGSLSTMHYGVHGHAFDDGHRIAFLAVAGSAVRASPYEISGSVEVDEREGRDELR